MADKVWEMVTSREVRKGIYGPIEIKLHFGMSGPGDEELAGMLLESVIGNWFNGLFIQDYQLTPKSEYEWEATVTYGRRFQTNFAIDSGSDRARIIVSKQTVNTFNVAGFTPIDFKRMINVKDTGGRRVPEGIDIGISGGTFTKTLIVPSPINARWADFIITKSWKMNSDALLVDIDPVGNPIPGTLTTLLGPKSAVITLSTPLHGITVGQTVDIAWDGGGFARGCPVGSVAGAVITVTNVLLGVPMPPAGDFLPPEGTLVTVSIHVSLLFYPGELLYEQGTLNRRGADDWEAVLRGHRSPNISPPGIEIAPGITITGKKGWDFAWLYSREETIGNFLTPVVKQCNIERVFFETTLDDLFNPTWFPTIAGP